MKINLFKSLLCITSLTSVILLNQSHALLLVEDSFSTYTNGTIAGQSSSATGLSGAWSAENADISGAVTNTGGLTFGSLATSGGALTVSASTNSHGYLTRSISASSPVGNEIWVSYLFNLTSFTNNNTDFGVTVGGIASDGGWGSQGKVYSGGMGISTNDPNSYTLGGLNPVLGTTYMFIGRFRNVGQNVNAPYDVWKLDLANYTAFIAAGGDLAALDLNNTTKLSHTSPNTETSVFNGNTLTLGGYNEGAYVGVLDEIRFGTDLSSVAIPEPSTYILLGLGLASLAVLRRKKA